MRHTHRIGTLAVAIVVMLGVAGCGSQADKNAVSAASSTATSASPTPSTEETSPTPSPTPAQTPDAVATPDSVPDDADSIPQDPSDDDADSVSTFDAKWARIYAGRIVEDIATADERLHQDPQIGVGMAFSFLADDMGDLLTSGAPPGQDEANYFALVSTLEKFYNRADANKYDDIMVAAAAYSVARERTSKLLNILNKALGTSYSLPAWKYM